MARRESRGLECGCWKGGGDERRPGRFRGLRTCGLIAAAAAGLAIPPSAGAGEAAAEPPPSPQARSLAGLRAARELGPEATWEAAVAAYGAVALMAGAPAHHRLEALDCLRAVSWRGAGLSARSPLVKPGGPHRVPRPIHRGGSPDRGTRASVELHVAPSGSDASPGTAALPFATLERARDEIRALKSRGGLPAGGIRVVVRGGEYRVLRTFCLSAEDGGTAAAPIVYRAAPGEKPRFLGGTRVSGFRPVEDPAILERLPEEARGKVMRADLEACGVREVPPLRLGGFASGAGFRTWPVVELFFEGAAMPLSRWPNEGFTRIAEVTGKEIEQSHGIQGVKDGRFTYEGDRPRRWGKEPDAWLYGYWFWDWADSYERVASIDPERREIVLAQPWHRYGYRKGQRFCAVNLLCEIDSPGEWYLDRASLALYFWPPAGAALTAESTAAELSLVDFPMMEIDGASHVDFVGLTWELGGADGIILRGGERCRFAGCTVRRFGGGGIEVRGGTGHEILSCDVESMGRGGIVLAGGDRQKLVPGDHLVENCHIHDLSRIDHTYTPGILVEGVGNWISHNLVHGVLSSAFRVEGNDHLIEGNEVFDVLLESDDQGGADMFGNPTYRGNVFRWNWWHHIGDWRGGGEEPKCGQAGIRLDDAICGVLVYGNIFQKCSAGGLGFGGVQIHGGKENVVDNNLFIDCAAAVSFSPWGEKRWRDFVGGALSRGDIDREIYLARYPELERLHEGHDSNHLWRNVIVRCGKFLLRGDPARQDLLENWMVSEAEAAGPSGAAVAGPEAFAGEGSPACARIGFRPIPLEEIGLYVDEHRSSLPAAFLRQARAR